MLQNIPDELRSLPQWCVAYPNAIPLDPKSGKMARVNDPSTWGTFEQAVATGLPHIGFVFAAEDPYAVIDLDDKEHDPATEADKTAFANIIKHFKTYTERSRSGRGWHLIARGSIGMGRRRGHVEVYSQGRFMILTGNGQGEIAERQELLNQLVAEMPVAMAGADLDDEYESDLTDAEIVEIASLAANGNKFDALCRGEMVEYPTQSQADFALLSIIAFYTKDNAQVRRIFRASALGKRDKAQKNDRYLNLSLAKIRGKEPPPIDDEQIVKAAEEVVPKSKKAPKDKPAKEEVSYEPVARAPGFLGELTQYFEATSVRPVHEIALTAAIGVLAGITGRAYNISRTGLNQYILLLAPTGTGKEEIQTGTDRLIAAVRTQVPSVDEFIGPAAFASGQALIRVLSERPGFVSIFGEFGLFMQQLSDAKAGSTNVMLKKVLLDLYGKSGKTSTLRSSVYSDSEKNTKIVQAPALSIVGESTPSTFFDSLSPTHITDGFIPRCLIVNYNGPRPPMNRNAGCPPSTEVLERMTTLATVAITCKNTFQFYDVGQTPEAAALFDAFNDESDTQINARRQEVEVSLWTRAYLKALKLAGLMAVADNPYAPEVTKEQAVWAIALVRKDIQAMSEKFFTGDVGVGDSKQINDLRGIFADYFKTDEVKLTTSYAIPTGLRQAGVVPYVYLSRRTMTLAAFRHDPRGSTFALKRSLEEMIAAGEIIELSKIDPRSTGYSGRAFVLKKPIAGS